MVSRGNLFPAQMAISCYRRQTYSNRELVIVSANPNSMLPDYLLALNDPSIRYIQVPPMPLGGLRNASVAAAQGEFLSTWDDDDLYGRERVERQVQACLQSNAAAHFLNRVLLWWPDRRLLGISAQRPWENTMMVRREALPPYPSLPLREDTYVVQELQSRFQITTSDDPELYCYVVHSSNTCDDAHFEHLFEQAEWVHPDYDEELVRLTGKYPIRSYADQMIAASFSDGGEVLSQIGRPPLIPCCDAHFGQDDLQVDGFAFQNCTFEGTRFLYLGGAFPLFENCNLVNTNIRFLGSASNTVNWIRYLKNLGMDVGI